MTYQQTRAFDPSKGGNKPLWCLKNVRLGYSIPPKYDNATQSWHNTERHRNRNIPKDVDVPLFYSFTTRNGNEGHINVQLASGKVWSDGKIYASLVAYEAASSPVYLGWGESVNNVKVIKEVSPPSGGGGPEMFSQDQIKVLASKGSIPQTADQLRDGAKKPAYDVALNFLLTVRNKLKSQVADQTKIIDAQNKQLKDLGDRLTRAEADLADLSIKRVELSQRPLQSDYDRIAGDLAKCIKAKQEDNPPARKGRNWLGDLLSWARRR